MNIVLVILIVVLVCGLGGVGFGLHIGLHNSIGRGYYGGGFGIIVVVLLVWFLIGR